MGKNKNRASMLVDLIRQNGSPNAELFDQLVPKLFGELHSLFTLLKKSKVLEETEFNSPPFIEEDGSATIVIDLSKDNQKRCLEYLDDIEHRVDYLAKDVFDVISNKTDTGISITFIRIE
jgi:tetrahydromethanopterin S-methyltransferase subunit G